MLLGLLLMEMGVATTVSREFISFLVIVISKVDLLVILHIAERRFDVPLVWHRIGLRRLFAAHSIVLFLT